jgi:hypothetical protein
MAVQTERITILGTPDFKIFLKKEAKNEGISISELVRQRCQRKPSEDDLLLLALIKEVKIATGKADASLTKGLNDAKKVLSELRSAK